MNGRDRGVRAAPLVVLAVAAYVLLPFALSDFWLAVLNLAGIAAVGAAGLNLLTGYAGQLSLGHAAFLGVGAYAGAAAAQSLGLPAPAWLVAATLAGGALGWAVSPFAVRYRGHTLAVVTLALVFVAQHVFRSWPSLTGGNAGRSDLPSLRPVGGSVTHDQGWFWMVWLVVALVVVLVANVVNGRPGRAMVAVREDERAAGVMGVDVARTKAAAFTAAGALAGLAGALYASYKGYVSPDEWSLLLSIQYLAIVLIGGMGTVLGPVLGALFVGVLPRAVEQVSGGVPFLAEGTARGLTVAQLNQLLFGLLIVVFVVAEPRGLVALLGRVTSRRRPAV